MKLNKECEAILKSYGFDDWDVKKIEFESDYTVYDIADKRITEEEAIAFLGLEKFLNGLADTTFNIVAYRTKPNGCNSNKEDNCYFFNIREEGVFTDPDYFSNMESIKLMKETNIKNSDGCFVELQFSASSRYLSFIDDKTTGACISVLFQKDQLNLEESSVKVAKMKGEKCYYWQDFYPPVEFIEKLIKIYKNSIYSHSNITECCGYDLGPDAKRANYCPVCGKKLIRK